MTSNPIIKRFTQVLVITLQKKKKITGRNGNQERFRVHVPDI